MGVRSRPSLGLLLMIVVTIALVMTPFWPAQASPADVGENSQPEGGQTYLVNDLDIEFTDRYWTSADAPWTGEGLDDEAVCAHGQAITLTGLADTTVADRVESLVDDTQTAYLKSLWQTKRLLSIDSCGGVGGDQPSQQTGYVDLLVTPQANFAGLLSIGLTARQPADLAEAVLPGINVRLDDASILELPDLFVPGTDLAAMLAEQAPASFPRGLDEATLNQWVKLIEQDPKQPFSFTESSVTLAMGLANQADAKTSPDQSPPGLTAAVSLDLTAVWPTVALYQLVDPSALFDNQAPLKSCPVLTAYHPPQPTATATPAEQSSLPSPSPDSSQTVPDTTPTDSGQDSSSAQSDDLWQASYCWSPQTSQLGQWSTDFATDQHDFVLPIDAAAIWRVQSSPERLTWAVSADDTAGSTLSINLPVNRTSEAISDVIRLEVINPDSGLAEIGTISIEQGALTAPSRLQVSSANASVVRGNVASVAPLATTVTLNWPNGEHVTVPVDAAGYWQADTPTGVGSGQLTIVATLADQSSSPTVVTLDATAPAQPSLVELTADRLSGWLAAPIDAGTVLRVATAAGQQLCRLTLPGSTDQPQDWSCPLPQTITSDTDLQISATDLVGNRSSLTARLDVTAPPTPQISWVSATAVAGTVDNGVDEQTVVRLTWGESGSADAPVAASGVWSLDLPAGVVAVGAVLKAEAIDGVGHHSAPLLYTVAASAIGPSPDQSAISLDQSSITVDVPPCGEPVEINPDHLTASVLVRDNDGAPLPGATVHFVMEGGLVAGQDYAVADDDGLASLSIIPDSAGLIDGAPALIHAFVQVGDDEIELAGSPVSPEVIVNQPAIPASRPTLTLGREAATPADGHETQAVSVDWIDGCGRPMAGVSLTVRVTGSAQLDYDSIQLDSRGQARLKLTDQVAETVNLTVESPVAPADPPLVALGPMDFDPAASLVSVVFQADQPSPSQSHLDVGETLVEADCSGQGVRRLTLSVADADGHPLLDVPVRFAADPTLQLSSLTGRSDAAGLVQVDLSGPVGASGTVQAWLEGPDQTLKVLAGPATPVAVVAGCAITAAPQAITASLSGRLPQADGRDQAQLTVMVADVNGRPIAGLVDSIQLVGDPALQISGLTDQGDGRYVAYISSRQAGRFSIVVSMTAADGTQRSISGGAVQIRFIPTLVATVAADLAYGPVLGHGGAHLANGQDAGVITVRLTGRSQEGQAMALVGQQASLSVAGRSLSTPTLNVDPAATGLVIGGFTETQPGVYQARVAASAAGDFALQVSWRSAGGTAVDGPPVKISFSSE
ncbi:MAG: hypothetical protein LBV30_09760 [Propionibacteriaceae bacterium]|jgi:hypothetical protein|nr:hypothetical protein [Propionibacteriaceae bacterium]